MIIAEWLYLASGLAQPQRERKMISHFDVFYEVVNPATQETDFVTEDRFIAERHYEKGYAVYERHRTITQHSTFRQTITYSHLQWNYNPEFEEAYNENDSNQ